MKIKITFLLSALFFVFTVFADIRTPVITQIEGAVSSTQQNLLINMIQYLNQFWADDGTSLSRKTTEHYFDPHTTLIINGKTVYTGYNQFDAHFRQVGQQIRGQILFPLKEVIGVGQQLIVHFDEDIMDKHGQHYPTQVIAIFTLRHHRILKWEEVVNTPYFCRPEAARAVYSH